MVSIIIPVFKVENYIDKCIQSILSQTYKNFQAIFIDDGSPDRCGEIIESYASVDKRIVVVHQKNMGVSAARNAGIKMATGEYLVFIDADDYVDSSYLETLISPFKNNANVQLSISNYSINGQAGVLEKEGVYSQIETARRLFTRHKFMGYLFNKMFLRKIIVENDIGFSETSHWCEDALFCSKYIKYIYNSYYSNKRVYNYIVRDDSATHSKSNFKHFSVLETYRQIIDLMNPLNDPELNKRLQVNYFIHCMDLKARYDLNLNCMEDYKIEIERQLGENKALLFSTYMPFKYKIKYFLLNIKI